jgi:hypothetical protein
MDGERSCFVTVTTRKGYKQKVICQEAASDVRRVEVTEELSQHYVALCPVKIKRGIK